MFAQSSDTINVRNQLTLQFPASSHAFTYPLTVRVVGAPQMTSQLVSSIFICPPLLSGRVSEACQSSGFSQQAFTEWEDVGGLLGGWNRGGLRFAGYLDLLSKHI